MKALLFILVLLAAGGAYWFYHDVQTREKLRRLGAEFQGSEADQERLAAYLHGKELFQASNTTPGATFEAWGDDPEESACPLPIGQFWLARGHMTSNKTGSPLRQRWCIAFDHATGKAAGRPAVGKEADDLCQRVDSGALQKASTASIIPSINPATPPPAPGSWMWDKNHKGALDAPQQKRH